MHLVCRVPKATLVRQVQMVNLVLKVSLAQRELQEMQERTDKKGCEETQDKLALLDNLEL